MAGDEAVLWAGARQIGEVIAPGGLGVTVSSQSGGRMPQLTAGEDRALAIDGGATASYHGPLQP